MTGTLSELWLQGSSRRGLQQEPPGQGQRLGGQSLHKTMGRSLELQTGRSLEARMDKLRSPGGHGVVGQARAKGKKQVTGQAKKKSTTNPRRS